MAKQYGWAKAETFEVANHTGETVEPEVFSAEMPGDGYYPVVPESRLPKSHTYTPYKGSNDWVEAANRLLADQAQYNFQYGKRR